MIPEDLAQTHAAAFTDQRPWSAEEFASLMSQTGMILCGDAKSFVLGRVIADEAEVLTLATHPDHQRKGLAQAALAQFLTLAQSKGATRVFLEVSETNTAAKTLYKNNNFSVIGTRPRYYVTATGDKVGADVMQILV
ncbi:MAG: GNAT family N-acetyltransferase [Yoonia sp.]|nr:GNAT family N-acetyltransferase [Yoonia sp.]MDG1863153.1 GNAT family N-acetyltransferase [Yoonia sp.]